MLIQTQPQPLASRQTSAAPAAVESTPDAAKALTSDFETFLLMLTTQMQNQDPLNPIESQDFAVQLATFSGVEQQVQTNELLKDLAAGFGASGLSQLAGWVGMEARVDAPAYFDGTPLTLAPDPEPAADAAVLVVTDATGRVVSREAVPPAGGQVLWAGVAPDGAPLPAGTYTFELESMAGGQPIGIKPVQHYALVQEASLAGGATEIVLRGGARVAASDVTALRVPGAG